MLFILQVVGVEEVEEGSLQEGVVAPEGGASEGVEEEVGCYYTCIVCELVAVIGIFSIYRSRF